MRCIFIAASFTNLVVVGATNGTSGTEREQVQSGVRVSNSLASYFVATYLGTIVAKSYNVASQHVQQSYWVR